MALDFIFMLTRADRTIPEAQERLPEALAAGVRHIGFKDVGLPPAALQGLARAIRAGGARSYLEVVSLDEASELASARLALELGVDTLMGGVHAGAVGAAIEGKGLSYLPYPGDVAGHPCELRGAADAILASAGALAADPRVHGLNLLAYRYSGDVPALIAQAARAARGKPLVVAGSIDSAERIAAVGAAGASAFTVGTAALEGRFPAPVDLGSQLAYILEAARAAPPPQVD
jgi:4-hydroxythreonine-4-phosphate dehydrogenase